MLMKTSDIRAMGIACPKDMDDESFAWTFLETDCPRITLHGFSNGPGFKIEARSLGDNRYLILETPVFSEGLDGVFMGELITAYPLAPDTLRLDKIVKPLHLAHYNCDNFTRGSASHNLVMRLGGEWESNLNGYLFFVHIPLASAPIFEREIGRSFERLA